MFSNWYLVVNICRLFRAKSDETDTHSRMHLVSCIQKTLLVVSCITHYYCLIFTTLIFFSLVDVFSHSTQRFSVCVSCLGSLFRASDHESNVLYHKNTFNSFPTCCTTVSLYLSIYLISTSCTQPPFDLYINDFSVVFFSGGKCFESTLCM